MKEPNCAKREPIISHTIFSQYWRLKQNFQVEAKVGLEFLWYACCIHQNTKLKTNKNKRKIYFSKRFSKDCTYSKKRYDR